MTIQAIFADRAFTPFEEIPDAVVVVDGPRIATVGRREQIVVPSAALRREAPGLTVVPGFVDVHIHGAAGRDVMEASPETPEALSVIAKAAAQRGTTSLVATTVTATEERTCRAVAGIAAWIDSQRRQPAGPAPQAEILGIHFEGPFISAARRGVHPAECITPPSTVLLDKFLAAARGAGRILTLAPELPGALELIAAARQRGLVVSMGHTDATFAEATEAIARALNMRRTSSTPCGRSRIASPAWSELCSPLLESPPH